VYKWLKAYLAAFDKDFPFSAVADRNEYEICRIIQHCVETNTEYVVPTDPESDDGDDGDEGGTESQT
jgi:hypothetical protein